MLRFHKVAHDIDHTGHIAPSALLPLQSVHAIPCRASRQLNAPKHATLTQGGRAGMSEHEIQPFHLATLFSNTILHLDIGNA